MTQYSKGIKTTKIKNSCEVEEDVGGNHRCSRQTLAQTHTRCWFVWFFSWLVYQIKK